MLAQPVAFQLGTSSLTLDLQGSLLDGRPSSDLRRRPCWCSPWPSGWAPAA